MGRGRGEAKALLVEKHSYMPQTQEVSLHWTSQWPGDGAQSGRKYNLCPQEKRHNPAPSMRAETDPNLRGTSGLMIRSDSPREEKKHVVKSANFGARILHSSSGSTIYRTSYLSVPCFLICKMGGNSSTYLVEFY